MARYFVLITDRSDGLKKCSVITSCITTFGIHDFDEYVGIHPCLAVSGGYVNEDLALTPTTFCPWADFVVKSSDNRRNWCVELAVSGSNRNFVHMSSNPICKLFVSHKGTYYSSVFLELSQWSIFPCDKQKTLHAEGLK